MMDYAEAIALADQLLATRHPVLLRHRVAEALVQASGPTHNEETCRYCIAAAARVAARTTDAVLV